jgi:T5SS/PEP-CTERM-associated repeat protein
MALYGERVNALRLLVASLLLCGSGGPAVAADKLWDNVDGGFFSEPANWFGGVPGTDDVARFETTDSNLFQRTYTVDFTTDPATQQLVVEDDGVTFNLKQHAYLLENPFVAAALGTVPNRSGNLTVTNGTLMFFDASILEIASVAGGSGALTVGAAGVVADTGRFTTGGPGVRVGLNGSGTLEINSGGFVKADRVTIGVNSGSTGAVTVTGIGSLLSIENDLRFSGDSGTLRITTGGRVSLSGDRLEFGGNGALHLEGGTLFAKHVPPHAESSFIWTSGTLSFTSFDDDLTVPNGGVLNLSGDSIAGNLTVLPGATTQVFISSSSQVDGHVVVDGGNLQLSMASGFNPSPQDKFEIITTGLGIFGSFANAANGQRLAAGDGSFLVNYGSGSPFDPTSVVLSSYQPPTPGDFDHDGNVDGKDFLFWQRGDSPTPGSVADLVAWRVNFGTSSSSALSTAAPEPRSALGGAIAFWASGRMGRRKGAAPSS